MRKPLEIIAAVAIAALTGLLALPAISSDLPDAKKPFPSVPNGERALADVKLLASPELKGRKSGTPEYRRAAEYVAAEMRKAGLRPGAHDGTYFQEVPLRTWSDFVQPARLEIVSPAHRVYFAGRGRDFTPVQNTGSGTVRGRLVFAGHGIAAPKEGWDDHAGLDLKGRIVLVLPDAPAWLGNDLRREWTLERKVKAAAAAGAVGLIELDLSSPSAPGAPRPRYGALRAGQCPEGFVVLRAGRDFASDAFYLAGSSWRNLVSKTLRLKRPHALDLGLEAEMEAHFVSGERTAPNVLGVLEGRDPKLKGEALILGGHLDHLGVGVDGWIYPGADDNASAVAVVLEVARTLAASGFKPARSIVFAVWAGEEIGLQGSRYYLEHPIFPLERTALYLNLDMVGTGDSDLLVGGMTEFEELFAVARRGLDEETAKKLRPRPNYRASDHASFWAMNVPAISLRTGEVLTDRLDDEHPEYHLPGDRPEMIDPELLALAARYHIFILRHLATTRENLLDPIHRTLFVHRDATVVDLARADLDASALRRDAIDLVVLPCRAPAAAEEADSVLARVEEIVSLAEARPDDLALVRSPEELTGIRNTGKTGVLLGIDGHPTIGKDLVLLRAFHRAGVRVITLAGLEGTTASTAGGGLGELGEKAVEEMNRLGMFIDVSGLSDEAFEAVLRVSRAPVIASRTTCRALLTGPTSLADETLKALAAKGGLAAIDLGAAGATGGVKAVVDHIEHIMKVTGSADHVGIGSGSGPVPGPTSLKGLTIELASRGHKPEDIRKVLGGNFLRVWSQVLASRQSQSAGQPSR